MWTRVIPEGPEWFTQRGRGINSNYKNLTVVRRALANEGAGVTLKGHKSLKIGFEITQGLQNRGRAADMGSAGIDRINQLGITWDRVVERLLA